MYVPSYQKWTVDPIQIFIFNSIVFTIVWRQLLFIILYLNWYVFLSIKFTQVHWVEVDRSSQYHNTFSHWNFIMTKNSSWRFSIILILPLKDFILPWVLPFWKVIRLLNFPLVKTNNLRRFFQSAIIQNYFTSQFEKT